MRARCGGDGGGRTVCGLRRRSSSAKIASAAVAACTVRSSVVRRVVVLVSGMQRGERDRRPRFLLQ